LRRSDLLLFREVVAARYKRLDAGDLAAGGEAVDAVTLAGPSVLTCGQIERDSVGRKGVRSGSIERKMKGGDRLS
jgi:hypothetical protein